MILIVRVQILQMNEGRPLSILRGFRVFYKMIISLKQGFPTEARHFLLRVSRPHL